MKNQKPTTYNITLIVEPQGPEWDGATFEVKLTDIPRASITDPTYAPVLRATVKTFENMVGLDTKDFDARSD